MHFYGHVRLTADIDFAYKVDPENARRLYAALREFWGGQVPLVEREEDLLETGMVFQWGRKPNRIDLLSHVDGLDFDEAWSRRVIEPIDGLELPIAIVSLEDLRRAKAAAGRPKDLDDLANLPVP